MLDDGTSTVIVGADMNVVLGPFGAVLALVPPHAARVSTIARTRQTRRVKTSYPPARLHNVFA
jgi:hypothetical protein